VITTIDRYYYYYYLLVPGKASQENLLIRYALYMYESDGNFTCMQSWRLTFYLTGPPSILQARIWKLH